MVKQDGIYSNLEQAINKLADNVDEDNYWASTQGNAKDRLSSF